MNQDFAKQQEQRQFIKIGKIPKMNSDDITQPITKIDQNPHPTTHPHNHAQNEWKRECISLQKLLKEQHSLLWTENEQKISFEKKLSDTILAYHRNKTLSGRVSTLNGGKGKQKQTKKISTKIKQAFEMVESKTVTKSQPTQDKVLLQDEGFGDSCFYIKQILLSLSKQPQLMLTILRKHHAVAYSQNCQSIIKSIVHSMYQNIVDDDIYNKDLFIIINQCFKLIVNSAKWYTDIKLAQDKSLAAMIVREFLERAEIKNYSKQILRNMVLEISKIDHEVSFLAEDNDKTSENKKDSSVGLTNNARLKKVGSGDDSPVKDQKLNQKSKVDNANSKISQYSQALQVKDEKMRISKHHSLDKQKGLKPKNRKCVSRQLLKYLGITQQIQFPTFVSSSANNELKKQEQINKQWAAMLNQKQSIAQINSDIILIKNIVLIFFSDLFKMLYTLPLSLRIACKIFYQHLEKKYTSKKGCFYVLAEYMLGLCVIKYIEAGDQYAIGDKISEKINEKNKPSTSNHVKTNLNTFSKIIMSVVKNDFKSIPKSFEYEFNMIVSNLRISLYNYMTQIVNIDSTKIHNLILKTPKQTTNYQQSIQKIKSHSVCMSVSDIKRLFEMIKFAKNELITSNKNQKLMKRIERIQLVTEGKDIFGDRQDKKMKLIYKAENAYVMFYELQLPKQLSVNYIKYHDNYFKNDKFKKMMKLFLLSINNLQHFPEFHQQQSLFGFLKKLSSKPKSYFQINSLIHTQNIDHVPVQIKIKYLVSLIKSNYSQTQYSSYLFQLVNLLYRQTIQRMEYYKTVWDKSKQSYLKALSSVIYLNQVIVNNQNIMAKNIKSKKLDEFIARTKIAVCLTSPKTRQKDIVSKTNIVKELAEDEKAKIWLENQARCIHTTLNLQFIKSLTGEPEKMKKEDSHCNSIMKFADVLCSLPQIKANNAQDIGVKEAFYDFIKYCSDLAIKQQEQRFGLDLAWLQQSLEQKLSKKIYDKLYPKDPSYEDVAFYLRLKTLDFVTYSHLKIKPCLRNDKMWELAGRQLRMMDKVKTAGEKLNCINECIKIIVNSYHLINDSDEAVSAEDIYPLVIYVLIKAAPKRMISNMTFIEYFANENKLKSKEGYAFSQVKSAIQFCDNLTEENLEFENMTEGQKVIEFRKTIYEKQIEYGIYFLLLRRNTSHQVETNNIKFLKEFFANISIKT